jgi:hypothetical protein
MGSIAPDLAPAKAVAFQGAHGVLMGERHENGST